MAGSPRIRPASDSRSLSCEVDGRPAQVLLVATDRRRTASVLSAVNDVDPHALYTIRDIKSLPAASATPGAGANDDSRRRMYLIFSILPYL